ncbi:MULTISPECIES: DUF397 domain-containing protein [unclassified Streptomyces]|uniref:DUF397 domain-containing protein n=1 Tax=unclassified Streptomyces TaxID=2593676 RepID=UPI0004763745|nr:MULTISPECIES: DUF397 domain-containing protein [unclassified Streptomyces]MYQ77603.1 DUF397 domain-containing protein [Streptomyces sp. SID4923]MYW13718.1 DUF397 domain-containing protein [Streptomyces sp. SID2563]NEC03698.1 DUF397 domain-containing protein [Streptomyces sp. SID7909]WUD00697.1 DUF397 domain-containing protein [Streptomyces sp. NBC_00523]
MVIRQNALTEWTKSSYSANGNCVEVKAAERHALLVRDSKSVSSGVLDFSAKTWSAFVLDVSRTAGF